MSTKKLSRQDRKRRNERAAHRRQVESIPRCRPNRSGALAQATAIKVASAPLATIPPPPPSGVGTVVTIDPMTQEDSADTSVGRALKLPVAVLEANLEYALQELYKAGALRRWRERGEHFDGIDRLVAETDFQVVVHSVLRPHGRFLFQCGLGALFTSAGYATTTGREVYAIFRRRIRRGALESIRNGRVPRHVSWISPSLIMTPAQRAA